MPVHNTDITRILSTLADLLEIDHANAFRVRAYREVARTVESLPRNVADLVAEGGKLDQLPAIGASMADKIREIAETGTLQQLEDLQQRVPSELSELLSLPGLGPKRVRTLHDELGIDDRDDLQAAAGRGDIQKLEGLGLKTEQKLLAELKKSQDGEKRLRLAEVEEIAASLLSYLQQTDGVKRVVLAGSYRRRRATVGDLDILVTCKRGTPVMDRFVAYDEVQEVVSQGTTRSTVRLRSGLQVDLRVVPQVSCGAALHYFTGSKQHNIAVRKLGVSKKLKINEYGVFRGDDRIAGRTEEEVYEQVDLPYIAPELREARGEIEAAREDALPGLITRDDLRGDLHCHSKASDGKHTLQEMAEAARQQGYEYLAITIHSKFDLSAQQQTQRVLRAMDNPHMNILAHPTGRMLGKRGPHNLDVERALQAARERGCFLEVNAQPDRLDLNDVHCKLAKEMGVKLALSTDSHTTSSLDSIRYGVDQARRGWLEPDDVINTRT